MTIVEKFAELRREGRCGLIPYLTVGYPTVEETVDLVGALIRGGADIVELGIPFSDPLADGATIQRASQRALDNGVTPRVCLNAAAAIHASSPDVPLIFMGYFNPILQYGLDAFCRDSAKAGICGLIVPDLPPEESDELREIGARHRIDLISLLAPTSTDERIASACRSASGFIYCVSLTGVTGARGALSGDLPEFLHRVRNCTDQPLAVGFGVSNRDHVGQIAKLADAAIVGSAVIDAIDRAAPEKRAVELAEFIRSLMAVN